MAPLSGRGSKSVDFLIRRSRDSEQVLWLLEAKASSPHPGGVGEDDSRADRFHQWISELVEKFTHTAEVLLAVEARTPRHALNASPDGFDQADLGARWVAVVVVPKHRPEWLPPIRDRLRKDLRAVGSRLGLEVEPMVLNGALAARLNLGDLP